MVSGVGEVARQTLPQQDLTRPGIHQHAQVVARRVRVTPDRGREVTDRRGRRRRMLGDQEQEPPACSS